jgi:hypothetical protein
MERVNVEGNRARSEGGGLRLFQNGVTPQLPSSLVDSRIANNQVGVPNSSGFGGGISVNQALQVRSTSFEGNRSRSYGAGIYIGNLLQGQIAILNSHFSTNWADDFGSAIAFESLNGKESPNPDSPLGADYGHVILNNTFSENIGTSQLHISNAGDIHDILFLNNIVQSSGSTPACSGDFDRLRTRRLDDPGNGVYNLLHPSIPCGSGFIAKPALGNGGKGWYFNQNYHVTAYDGAGDIAACDYLMQKDAFRNKRSCKPGSVEAKPAAVKAPVTP